MATADKIQLDSLILALDNQCLIIPGFVVSILSHSAFAEHPAVLHLLSHSEDVLNALLDHPGTKQFTLDWANTIIKAKYSLAIKNLAHKENGWHFVPTHAATETLETFRIEEMAQDMKELSPELWDLIGLLLSADQRIIVIISMLMQSANQQSNILESVIGIFLHASNTPSKVIETLAHMGISISIDSIHNAVHSLSRETYHRLRAMGQSLLVSYAYDNFDINFPHLIPTLEKTTDTLTHMTSCGLLYLEHGVKTDHLKCSEELWKTNPLNPSLNPSDQFKGDLGKPEMVEQVPVVKMRWAPAKSMDIKQSTVSGNLDVIPQLLEQGGVGDPSQEDQSIWERNIRSMVAYIILFHGDLGTGERIMSLLQRRSIEDTPWQRYQYVIYVIGLFHLKMACADAIWRIFIEPKLAREDVNSLMHFVALHRPKETGKISSDPGFRRMHDIIMHSGAALRLDAWRVELLWRDPTWTSLEGFASSKPSWYQIGLISEYLASHYVAAAEDLDIWELRQKPKAQRDQQHENVLQMHRYFCLYEEMSFAMNYGDIGRVETLFPPWIYIFKATGKHKYAAHMVKFMTDVHFVYPPPLRHAIRYNMLPNPTGEEGKCRGVDWVVEQMINLPTKDTYGGRGSNYTKKRVLEESPLIQIYNQCCGNIERNFLLSSYTSRQATPNMTKTLAKMSDYMQIHGPNETRPGRTTVYMIPDIIDEGQGKMFSGKAPGETDPEEYDKQEGTSDRNIEPDDLLVDT
ncbi:hypothetical protein B0H10DRAFT_1836287 [Mycena sp. CBHHK59/15]|nr:hypothetical protein B0H10DRAFT_1836287 [Mycena sp. CBHHK59/15]